MMANAYSITVRADASKALIVLLLIPGLDSSYLELL